MRADGVVDVFPVAEFAIEGFPFQRTGGDLVELFAVGGVGAFDGAVEFGGARRQDEPVQCALLTSLFERGGELGAAVDLQGANGKGHAKLQGIEELSGGWGGGAGVRLQYIATGNHIAGGEPRGWDVPPVCPPRPGPRAQTPHIPWVGAPRTDADAGRDAIPELRYAALPPACLAA